MTSGCCRDWYRRTVLVRRLEEGAERSFRRAKIDGYLHVYTGEAVATGFLAAARDEDLVFAAGRSWAGL